MMSPPKAAIDFLIELGADKFPHSGAFFLDHLVKTYNLMARRGLHQDLCCGGLFHSIYGTERFSALCVPITDRYKVQGVIGVNAEFLAYWNCAMKRETFDVALKEGTTTIQDRFLGSDVTFQDEKFDQLMYVHLYEWLEKSIRGVKGDKERQPTYELLVHRLHV